MAFMVLVIDVPNESIAQLNAKVVTAASRRQEGVASCRNYLDALLAGAVDGSVQVTTRSTDPSVATAGTGSAQVTYNLK